MSQIVTGTQPPYYAVIFTSQRTDEDAEAYGEVAQHMAELAAKQPGFLGMESVRDAGGTGITVSYWESVDAIRAWKANEDHLVAQQEGKKQFYRQYQLRICQVQREYGFPSTKKHAH